MANYLRRKNNSKRLKKAPALHTGLSSADRSGFAGKNLLFLAILGLTILFNHALIAQTTVQIGIGTDTATNTLYGPVYRYSSTSTTSGARANMVWTAAEMTTAGIPSGALITKVEFNKTNIASFNGTVPFQMLAANTADTALATSLTWNDVLATHTPVINDPNFNVPSAAGWASFVFANPFPYAGGALEIATEYSLNGLASPHSTDGFRWQYTSGSSNKIVATPSATGSTLSGTTTAYKHRPNIKITYVIPTACTGTPNAGTISSSVPTICSGGAITLSATGVSLNTGITRQWQSSPTGAAGSFTDISGANAYQYTTNIASTTYYRLKVTCNGTNDAYSNTISVTTPAPISGSFTINNNAPASATNFQSFTDAINSLACGIGGSVTFTVDPASGPYLEQVEITNITGMSAANPITIQGNGRTLTANPVTANRYAIKLNGAKYVTINNLNIETASASSYGWGIHFTNGADNNTISNNTITIGSSSTTESNSAGIVFVNSTSSVTTTGGDNGNNNIITGNTIIGAYKGIHLNNLVTSAGNNQITNNIIRDFYSGGIEVNGANGTLIEGNDISRANRTSVGSFYGIVLGGTAQNTIISKNRLHNTHDAATTLTGSVFGIYSSGNDAPTGQENIVKNNLVYNVNNSTGNINALYNSSSDGVYYYNNSISLDNAGSTGIARGIYQTTAASNLKLINNNIVITSGGPAASLQAIYLNTATTVLISNNNNLYVPTGNIGYYSGADYATLAAWQGANTTTPWDTNSVSADPAFVNAASGNLMPSNSALNNAAQPLAIVTDDITGALRNATTPDIGAYEFTPAANDAGITAILSPLSSTCGASTQETVTVTIQNFGLATLTNIPVTYQINNGSFVPTETIPGPIASGASITYNFTAKANLNAGGTFVINAKSMLTGDANATNDSSTTSIDILNPITTFPYLEDFETFVAATNATGFMNGWEVNPANTTADYRWNVDVSTTTSSNTGPSVDHTLGTSAGTYVFTEASSGAQGDSALLVSRCISLPATTPMGLEFWYHMYGADMGTLHVDIFNGTTWVSDVVMITGQQQTASTDPWRRSFINLSAYSGNTIRVRFRGERGVDYEGDMAIDDVRILEIPTITASGATTFCQGDSVVLTASTTTTGVTYQWFENGTAITGATNNTLTVLTAGSYTVETTLNGTATSSPMVVTVNPLPATPTITQSGPAGHTLTSSSATGNQWYLNGNPIAGATGETYNTTANGNYTVVVTDTACSSNPSAMVNITNTGIKGALAGMSVNVYPNPSKGQFNVKLTGYKQAAALELYSLTGQLIVKKNVKAGQEVTPMEVKNLAAGTYLLKVVSAKGVQISKIIVE